MHGCNNGMNSDSLIAAIYSQVQTNFNGLVQLAEAETCFQREVFKRLKCINEKLECIDEKLDKIYQCCKKCNGHNDNNNNGNGNKKPKK